MPPKKRRSKFKARKGKKLSPHGLMPYNFPMATRWMVDSDYAKQLSEEEAKWLSDFNNAYYGHKFTEAQGKDWPKELKSEAYRNDNGSRKDAMFAPRTVYVEDLDPLVSDGSISAEPTEEYLNSADYKAALKEYRASLKERDLKKPYDEKKHEKTKRMLYMQVTHSVDTNTDED